MMANVIAPLRQQGCLQQALAQKYGDHAARSVSAEVDGPHPPVDWSLADFLRGRRFMGAHLTGENLLTGSEIIARLRDWTDAAELLTQHHLDRVLIEWSAHELLRDALLAHHRSLLFPGTVLTVNVRRLTSGSYPGIDPSCFEPDLAYAAIPHLLSVYVPLGQQSPLIGITPLAKYWGPAAGSLLPVG